MAEKNEARVYFLRSKTICRGQELKFVCTPRTDWRPMTKARSGAGCAPPPIRGSPEDSAIQHKTVSDLGLTLLNLRARQYQLVKPGLSCSHLGRRGWFYHGNFEAKPVDDPEAPDELFFVELVLGGGSMEKPITAYIIENLGRTDSLSDDDDDDDDDDDVKCSMCTYTEDKTTPRKKKCSQIRHPKNVKLNYDYMEN